MPPELAEESLLYDLYYRENMKSRPPWAPDPSLFSHITRKYCKNGKMSHIEPFHYRFPGKGVKSMDNLPKRLSEAVYVHFDYESRDALSHQAKTTEYLV